MVFHGMFRGVSRGMFRGVSRGMFREVSRGMFRAQLGIVKTCPCFTCQYPFPGSWVHHSFVEETLPERGRSRKKRPGGYPTYVCALPRGTDLCA